MSGFDPSGTLETYRLTVYTHRLAGREHEAREIERLLDGDLETLAREYATKIKALRAQHPNRDLMELYTEWNILELRHRAEKK